MVSEFSCDSQTLSAIAEMLDCKTRCSSFSTPPFCIILMIVHVSAFCPSKKMSGKKPFSCSLNKETPIQNMIIPLPDAELECEMDSD